MSVQLIAKAFFVVVLGCLLFVPPSRARGENHSQIGGVSARALYYDQGKPDSVTTQKPPVPPVLALRVSVKLVVDGGGSKEVKPSTTFRTGDRIRLMFATNKEGYLYLATVGSSGEAAIVLPDKSGRPVFLRKGYDYEYPVPHKVFKFDTRTGEEHIYAFLSEAPLDIIDFGKGQQLPVPSDTAQRPRPDSPPVVASASAVRSRDLVVEEDAQAQYISLTPASQKLNPPIAVKLTLTHRDAR